VTFSIRLMPALVPALPPLLPFEAKANSSTAHRCNLQGMVKLMAKAAAGWSLQNLLYILIMRESWTTLLGQ
jgi:hypothetical protein